MEYSMLQIKLSKIEYHLFNGGWKIHHIVPLEYFESQKWTGYKIYCEGEEGSYTVHTDTISAQDFEIITPSLMDLWYWKIKIDDKVLIEQFRFRTVGQDILTQLQKNEGLTAYEFHTKFLLNSNKTKPFKGKIIHLTNFKY